MGNETRNDLRGLAQRRARERAAGSIALERAWLAAFERIGSLCLPEQAVDLLSRECRSPTLLSRMADLMASRSTGNDAHYSFGLLLAAVDNSPFSLRDWLVALETFIVWLDHKDRRAEFSALIGYLECCSSAAAARSPRANLSATLAEMLDTYGFEG